MKLLLVFALLALVCMARSAPTSPTTSSRQLIFSNYDEDEEPKANESEAPKVDDDDDDDDVEILTTTTTTTSRRTPSAFPTRNRNIIPSRRPAQTPSTTIGRRTTTAFADDEQEENGGQYDGDFKYIRDFRKYVQKLVDDIRKIVRNLTGYDLGNPGRQQQYSQDDE